MSEERFALGGFFAWFGITAGWWALAFAPLPAAEAWLAAARSVCFGTLPNGLPEPWGWMLLVLAPAAMLWVVALLALMTVQAIAVDRLGGEHWLRPVIFAAVALFMAFVTVALLRYVLDRRPITSDKVFGAICAYVLIAFTFASIFSLLQYFQPAAFYVNPVNEPDGHLGWSSMMYFSFTVLT